MTARRGRLWWIYLLVGLAAVGAYYLVPAHGTGSAARVLVYCAASISAAVVIGVLVVRGRLRPQQPWLLIGASQLVYAAGDGAFYLSHYLLRAVSYPALADLLYFAHYPLLMAGLILLIHRRARGRDLAALLDAAMLAVVAGLLSYLFLIAPGAAEGESALVKATEVAYPMLDLALLVVVLRLVLGPGRRPATFFLLTANLTAILAADACYVVQQLSGTYHTGNFLDGVWLGANLILGAAALHPTASSLGEPSEQVELSLGPGRIVALCATALVAPVVLLVQNARNELLHLPVVAGVCVLLFVLVVIRLADLLAAQRRVAVIDALTGLHTRRYLEAQLPVELRRARRNGSPLALFMIDVDHFKAINDRYGHPAGDRALREIASRLRAETRNGDVLARYGGEEFALLSANVTGDEQVRLGERLRGCVSRTPLAVSANVWVTVTVSIGSTSCPAHGGTPRELFETADRALYAAKALGRDNVVAGDTFEPAAVTDTQHTTMVEYLCRLADQVDAQLSQQEHSRAIGRWAALVAAEMGCDGPGIRCAALGGRLHDIGKIVVPETILTSTAPLTDEQWRLLRQHPEHGHRLASAVPGLADAAEVVRQHHERHNGGGYPDGLTGDQIRPEARIVAVCDAWAAMRSDRPYRPARDGAEARAELLRERGGQFDPAVVDVFLALHARGLVGDPQPRRPDTPRYDDPTVPTRDEPAF
ncbi:MAG: diguanylate cyclase [Actinocatenispora sp.]